MSGILDNAGVNSELVDTVKAKKASMLWYARKQGSCQEQGPINTILGLMLQQWCRVD